MLKREKILHIIAERLSVYLYNYQCVQQPNLHVTKFFL